MRSLDLVNNTFFEPLFWMAFTTQQASEPVLRATNNVILGGVAGNAVNPWGG